MDEKLVQKLSDQFPWFPNDMYVECNNGWFDILFKMLAEIDDFYYDMNMPNGIVFLQIKEKFGSLRCYVAYYEDGVQNIIDKYEKLSESVCELCGNSEELGCERNNHRKGEKL